MTIIYAGIGSRKTPHQIREQMANLAYQLAANYQAILRTGGAPGADFAFIDGAREAKGLREIYLPNLDRNFTSSRESIYAGPWDNKWMKFAAKYHPAWERCSPQARKLHARNGAILIGPDFDHPIWVNFIICWTPNGEITGGTGQALRIAQDYNIPVLNLGRNSTVEEIFDHAKYLSQQNPLNPVSSQKI